MAALSSGERSDADAPTAHEFVASYYWALTMLMKSPWVPPDTVAEKAGLTKKTLYYHFRSKDDLVTVLMPLADSLIGLSGLRWLSCSPVS